MVNHYSDVIMSTVVSQITSVSIVCSTVCSDADQANIKASCHWPLKGIHRSPVDSSHKGPVTRKMFPLDDVIMLKHHDAVMNEINIFQIQFVNQAGSAFRRTDATKFSKLKSSGKRPKMRVYWLEAILLHGRLEMYIMPWGPTYKQTFVIEKIQSLHTTNFSEIITKIQKFSFAKMHMK